MGWAENNNYKLKLLITATIINFNYTSKLFKKVLHIQNFIANSSFPATSHDLRLHLSVNHKLNKMK